MDSNHHLIPSWLSPFLKATYFVSCQQHCESSSAKRECNLYCLLCKGDSLCSCCMVEHKNHPTVQIRRSSYSNVVRLKEISQYIDASNIQAYRINNERVIFLKERPILRPGKAGGPGKCSGTTCEICKRNLLDTSIYCSLGCKLEGVKRGDSRVAFEVSGGIQGDNSSNDNKDCSSSDNTTNAKSPPRPRHRRKGVPNRSPFM